MRYPAGYGGAAMGAMSGRGGYPAAGYGGAMYGAAPVSYGYGYGGYG